MAVIINNAGDAKSGFICYAEIDHTFQVKDYLIRITPRGLQWFNNDNSINVFIDFHNITDGTFGRFDNVVGFCATVPFGRWRRCSPLPVARILLSRRSGPDPGFATWRATTALAWPIIWR